MNAGFRGFRFKDYPRPGNDEGLLKGGLPFVPASAIVRKTTMRFLEIQWLCHRPYPEFSPGGLNETVREFAGTFLSARVSEAMACRMMDPKDR